MDYAQLYLFFIRIPVTIVFEYLAVTGYLNQCDSLWEAFWFIGIKNSVTYKSDLIICNNGLQTFYFFQEFQFVEVAVPAWPPGWFG